MRVVFLNSGHSFVDGFTDVLGFLEQEQPLEAGLLREIQDAPGLVVGLADRTSPRSFALEFGFECGETAVGELEEDQAQNGYRVLGCLEVGVGPQLVCRFPEASRELLDIPFRWLGGDHAEYMIEHGTGRGPTRGGSSTVALPSHWWPRPRAHPVWPDSREAIIFEWTIADRLRRRHSGTDGQANGLRDGCGFSSYALAGLCR